VFATTKLPISQKQLLPEATASSEAQPSGRRIYVVARFSLVRVADDTTISARKNFWTVTVTGQLGDFEYANRRRFGPTRIRQASTTNRACKARASE
jgi:hypothetical protein